jgi:transcriptional regulator with XRE-family HTH domain
MRKSRPIGKDTKNIAKRVRALRESQNVRQVDMARQLGLTQQHWSAIESGKHPFDVEMLQAIADMYGVSLMELIYDVSENEISKDAMRAIVGTTVAKAYEDRKFRELVVGLAMAHRNPANNWIIRACRSLLDL